MSAENSKVDQLYRRIDLTSRSRFNAYHRLRRHAIVSLWMVTMLSIALIIIPLLQAIGFTGNISLQKLNVLQVALAIAVMAFSLLLGREDYSLRAERMHQSGNELRKLTLDLIPFLNGEIPEEIWSSCCDNYHKILKSYPNHSPVDYAQTKVDIGRKEKLSLGFLFIWLRFWFRYFFGFFHYIFLFIMFIFIFIKFLS